MSINWFGAYTLFKKEIWRFMKVYHQTLFAPIINSLLFLAVFDLALGNKVNKIGDVEFRGAKLCSRCKVTTIDPMTGTFGEEPLKTMTG